MRYVEGFLFVFLCMVNWILTCFLVSSQYLGEFVWMRLKTIPWFVWTKWCEQACFKDRYIFWSIPFDRPTCQPRADQIRLRMPLSSQFVRILSDFHLQFIIKRLWQTNKQTKSVRLAWGSIMGNCPVFVFCFFKTLCFYVLFCHGASRTLPLCGLRTNWHATAAQVS